MVMSVVVVVVVGVLVMLAATPRTADAYRPARELVPVVRRCLTQQLVARFLFARSCAGCRSAAISAACTVVDELAVAAIKL
jgi:hypothetical protein